MADEQAAGAAYVPGSRQPLQSLRAEADGHQHDERSSGAGLLVAGICYAIA